MTEVIQSDSSKQNSPLKTAPMPVSWRLGIAVAVVAIGSAAYFFQEQLASRARAGLGILCFLGLIAAFSANLRAVNWKTFAWGIFLQFSLGVAIIHVKPVQQFFDAIVYVVKQFLAFTNEGSKFVFGKLADPAAVAEVFKIPISDAVVFAFVALPTIIFVASFFTVL